MLKKYVSGFNAFGKEVPVNRMARGLNCVKEIIPDISSEKAYTIVGKFARHIKRDMPFELIGSIGIDKDISFIDITGRYRLLATMLTD